MATRRDCLLGSAALAAAELASPAAARAAGPEALCDLVDPFIGTGGHGHTYPGAATPFGMVQLSPDTDNDNARWDACSGYHLGDASLLGFSHTHLSGTGVGDLLDVLVAPGVGKARLSPGTLAKPEGSYRQRFDHADEHASPGDYRVRLKDSGVAVELTATPRVGLHRYRFAGQGAGWLLVDLSHGIRDAAERPTNITDAHLEVIGADMLVGSRRVQQWAGGRVIHFALQVSRPFARADLYSQDRPVPGGEAAGASLKAVLAFPDASAAPLLVKVAISGVDRDGALRNLRAEAPGWAFDEARAAARAAWERELSRVRIEGGDRADRRIYYTGLYHAMLAPTLFSDVDGRYRGMDTAVHTLAPGEFSGSTYSLWDTYRALHPFFTLVDPDRAGAFAGDLVRQAEQSPSGPPVWPLQGIETRCMIGWHSAAVVAEAIAKGLPGVDARRAWAAFRKRALEDDVEGLGDYKTLGFIPSDKVAEAASKTLEYAYDDWAMASMAQAAGDEDAAVRLKARSRNYRNLFDAASRFVKPRLASGAWAEPFDPRALGHGHEWRDFTECNSWQATFLNQHDVHAYIAMFGGDAAFIDKLDGLFSADSTLPPDAPDDIAGLVGQYAHGNEPSHHIAYLYAYAGQPAKTQARVRMLMKSMYRDQPDGLAGNEDCGQMSAWYLLSALGLYPVDPVSGNYVFGAPLFPCATLSVGGGRTLSVEAPGVGPRGIYVQAVEWNGRPWTMSWIRHAELAAGGRLVFRMGERPNPAFGAPRGSRPPSFA